ncbi:hypothetical protein ID007_004299 [Salmonella enterica]|nr:hypothetical protein [Salmonella enterica]
MRISFKIASIADINAEVNKQIFSSVSKTVDAIGQKVAMRWVDQIDNARLWSVEKDAYRQSVSWQMTGPFKGVVSADYKYASDIETGRPARDLKRMLGTSLKVRRTTKGQRFLVIPFRHNTKSMPPALYAQAKGLEASRVTSMTQRRSGEITNLSPRTGMTPAKVQTQFLSNPKTRGPMMVNQAKYQWGGRLAAGYFGPNPKGKTDIAAGMVRMDTSTGKAKSSAYLTFRVMSEKSSGWIVPPQPGMHLAQKAVDSVMPAVNDLFAAAVKSDLANLNK